MLRTTFGENPTAAQSHCGARWWGADGLGTWTLAVIGSPSLNVNRITECVNCLQTETDVCFRVHENVHGHELFVALN